MRPALSARNRMLKRLTGGFPALASPVILLFGDSLTAHEHANINTGAVTFTRDGTTNLGRITAPMTSTTLFGTPEVQLVNLTDGSFEVYGRNNYPDATSTGISIHTRVADAIATRAPSFNPSTAGTTTQTAQGGCIIALGYKSHRGTAQNTNALFGGGMEIIGNLGHPAYTSAQMTNELAYAKQILAQYTNPVVFFKSGTNDIKGNTTPNVAFTNAKVLLDGLTGLDGNGGNALVVIGSVPALGSGYTGPATYQVTNEQWIGKCATSAAPGTLNVDASLYTIQSVAQKTLNRQYYEYALANPTKVLFVDETTDSYDFTNQCMYDASHLDPVGAPHTLDNTHYITNSAILQAKRRHDALVAASMTFPVAVPRSSADASTYNGHTRLANRGPWVTTGVTSGFNTGGSGTQPTGWSCGHATGSGTMVVSITDPGDGLGMWVNAVCTPGAANDEVIFYPYTSSGVSPATLGVTNTDLSEMQMVCEVKWDTASTSGLACVYAQLTTASGGLYGAVQDGFDFESPAGGSVAKVIPDNVNSRVLSTGWLQMSNASMSIVLPQIRVKFGSITGVPVTVSVRCVGINKR